MDAKEFLYTQIAKSGSKPITEDDIAYFKFIEKLDDNVVISAINELLSQHKIVKFYYDKKTKIANGIPSSDSIIAYRPYFEISSTFTEDLFK